MKTQQQGCPALEELHRVQPAVGYPVTSKKLTSFEREVVEDSEVGFPRVRSDTSPDGRRIRASVIRDLLLGEVLDDGQGYRTTHSRGVVLSNAMIVDDDFFNITTLDVSGCVCLRPLSLICCHLNGLVARHSSMDGGLLLRGCTIDHGIDAYGFQGSAVELVGGCVGVLAEDDLQPQVHADGGPVSLDVGQCDIRGDVTLDGVWLRGAANLMDSRARYVLLRAVKMDPAESDLGSIRNSVSADRMTVHGSVHIKRCDFRVGSKESGGAVCFAGATIGSEFVVRATSAGQNGEGGSVVLQNMKISGRLLMDGEEPGVTEKTEMLLSGDIVLADTSASRITISNLSARAMDARGVSVHVELNIGPGATIQDLVDASGCRLGKLSLLSSRLGRSLDHSDEPSLLLRNATLLGDLHIGAGTEIRRMTDLHHLHVDGDVLISGPRPIRHGQLPTACCDGPSSSAQTMESPTVLRAGRQGCALAADFASVRGKLQIDQAKVDGSITLESADLGQVCLSRSEVGANRGYAINANRAHVRGPMVLGPSLTALGPVCVEDAAAGFIDVCARIRSKGEQSDHNECSCEPAGKAGQPALSLARTTVASSVRLSDDVTMDGALSVFASRIGESLLLGSAEITGRNDEGNSLVASRVQIENNLTLDDGFCGDGGVAIRGGQVGGKVVIRGDTIGINDFGFSVFASFLSTGRGISIQGHGPKGLDLGGAIDLRNASTKDLEICDVHAYADPTGTAIVCDGLNAVRSIFLTRVTSHGKLSLVECAAADLGFTGSIAMAGSSHCTGLDLSRSSITHHVLLDCLDCWGHVKIREASLGNLTMKHANIQGPTDCHHSTLGSATMFSLDAMGLVVKNDLDISHLSTDHNVFITSAAVGRTFTMKDLGNVDGRLWLSGTSVETVILLDEDLRLDQAIVPGITTF